MNKSEDMKLGEDEGVDKESQGKRKRQQLIQTTFHNNNNT
jgi:hypothetical protein